MIPNNPTYHWLLATSVTRVFFELWLFCARLLLTVADVARCPAREAWAAKGTGADTAGSQKLGNGRHSHSEQGQMALLDTILNPPVLDGGGSRKPTSCSLRSITQLSIFCVSLSPLVQQTQCCSHFLDLLVHKGDQHSLLILRTTHLREAVNQMQLQFRPMSTLNSGLQARS